MTHLSFKQVTEESAAVLTAFGIKCSSRGVINVKGKGLLPTFFVSINDALEFIKDGDSQMSASSFEAQL